jgi:hypothetical protein
VKTKSIHRGVLAAYELLKKSRNDSGTIVHSQKQLITMFSSRVGRELKEWANDEWSAAVCNPSELFITAQDDEIRIHRKDSLYSINSEQRATSLDNKSHYLVLAYLEQYQRLSIFRIRMEEFASQDLGPRPLPLRINRSLERPVQTVRD